MTSGRRYTVDGSRGGLCLLPSGSDMAKPPFYCLLTTVYSL